jgi:hypothetical protein
VLDSCSPKSEDPSMKKEQKNSVPYFKVLSRLEPRVGSPSRSEKGYSIESNGSLDPWFGSGVYPSQPNRGTHSLFDKRDS